MYDITTQIGKLSEQNYYSIYRQSLGEKLLANQKPRHARDVAIQSKHGRMTHGEVGDSKKSQLNRKEKFLLL